MADPISLDSIKKLLAKLPSGVEAPECSIDGGRLLLSYHDEPQYSARTSLDADALRKAGIVGASEVVHPKGGAFAVVSFSL